PTPMPVTPWCEVKSRRGAPKHIDTHGFACPNRTCAYYRITDAQVHALVGDGTHGKHERIQTLRCQACMTTFSARRDTPLYRLKTASARLAEVLTALSERLDVAAAVRVFGQRPATSTTWLTRAGMHSATLHDRWFQNLHLAHLQLDELRTRLRSRAHTLWLWVVVDPISKLIPVLHHPEGTGRADPGRRPHRRPRSRPAAGARLYSGVHQRRLESVLLCPDGPLRAVDPGRGAAGPPVAGGGGAAVWAGEEALSTAEAHACDPSAALWNARSIEGRTYGARAKWAAQYRICRARESEAATKCGRVGPPDLVDAPGRAAVAAAAGLVARALFIWSAASEG